MTSTEDLAVKRDRLKRELADVEREIKLRHGEVDDPHPPPDPKPDPEIDPASGKAVADVAQPTPAKKK